MHEVEETLTSTSTSNIQRIFKYFSKRNIDITKPRGFRIAKRMLSCCVVYEKHSKPRRGFSVGARSVNVCEENVS